MPHSAYAIFCDDLRLEANGKRILIGMYGFDMLVPSFPYQMHQLVILANVRCDPKHKPRELRFEVSGLNQESFVHDVPQEELARLASLPSPDDAEISHYEAALHLTGGRFERETEIRVVAHVDGKALRAGKLRVRQRSQDQGEQTQLKRARSERKKQAVKRSGVGTAKRTKVR